MDSLAAKLAKESGMGAPVPTQNTNDLNGLDPREVVDVRFFLKPEELEEAPQSAMSPVTRSRTKP